MYVNNYFVAKHFVSLDKENLNRSDASLSGFDSPNMKLVSFLNNVVSGMGIQ